MRKKKTHGLSPLKGDRFKRKMSTIPNSKSSIFKGYVREGCDFKFGD